MADTEAPEREQRTAPKGGGAGLNKKLGPLPVWAWAVGGGALAAVAWKWWTGRKSKAGTSGSSAPTLGTQSINACYDQYGNTVPCQGYTAASQYDTLLAAIQGLQGGQGTSVPTTSTTTTPTTSTSPTPTSSSCPANQYPAPSGVTAKAVSSTSASVQWNTLSGQACPPSSYTVAVYQLNGKTVSYGTTSCPDQTGGKCSATVTGLHPGWSYNVHVWANGGKVAPPHASAKVSLPSK